MPVGLPAKLSTLMAGYAKAVPARYRGRLLTSVIDRFAHDQRESDAAVITHRPRDIGQSQTDQGFVTAVFAICDAQSQKASANLGPTLTRVVCAPLGHRGRRGAGADARTIQSFSKIRVMSFLRGLTDRRFLFAMK
jgi:hypothetical protein